MDRQLSIVALPEFIEAAEQLTKEGKVKLFKTLKLLSGNRSHPGLRAKKLKANVKTAVFECRVDRSLRLIYDLCGNQVRCWFIGDHDVAQRFGETLRADKVSIDDIQVKEIKEGLADLLLYLSVGEAHVEFAEFDIDRLV